MLNKAGVIFLSVILVCSSEIPVQASYENNWNQKTEATEEENDILGNEDSEDAIGITGKAARQVSESEVDDSEGNEQMPQSETSDSENNEQIPRSAILEPQINDLENEAGILEEENIKLKEEAEETKISETLDGDGLSETLPEKTELAAEKGIYAVTAGSGCSAKQLQELLDLNSNGEYSQLTVNIPAGTYKLDRPLYVNSNTIINADKDAVLQKQSGNGALLANRLVNDNGGYDGTSNIIIKGGIWDSKPLMSAKEGTETFRFIHAQNITVSDAVLRNVPEGSHLIVFSGVRNAKVVRSVFYGYGDNKDKVRVPKEAVQLDVAHNELLTPTLQPVQWDDLPCEQITVCDSQFYDFSRGIGSHTAVAGILHKNVTITGNKFWDLEDTAIRVYNYKDVTISGNNFKNVSTGVLAYTYLEEAEEDSYFQPLSGKTISLPSDYKIIISGNTIESTKLLNGIWGDGIRVAGGSQRPLSGVKISENIIKSAARYGIFTSHTPKVEITGNNSVALTKKHGILVQDNSKNAVISGNKIIKAGESGIGVYGSPNVSVTKNTVSLPAQAGVYVYKSINCLIGSSKQSYNTVTSPGKQGIYLTTSCTGSRVLYNRISKAAQDGIGVYSSRTVVIKANRLTAAGTGICINTNSVDNKIDSNIVSSAGKYGIWTSSGSKRVSINRNTVGAYGSKGKYAGIYVYKSGGTSSKYNSKLTFNKIKGTGSGKSKDGIKISTAPYTTITGNAITTPAGSGIYVYRSQNCTVGDNGRLCNTISSPKGHGIYVTSSCVGSRVQYNRISKAAADGIGVYNSRKVVVKANRMSAGESGIYVNTNCVDNKIDSNTITSAGKYGIWVSSGSKRVSINKNVVNSYGKKGSYAGIYVYKAGGSSSKYNTNITNNKIVGSGGSKKKDGIKVSTASYTTVSKNTISSAAGCGVYIYKSKYNKIEKNKVINARSKGIYVTTASDKVKIFRNNVSKAADTAIATYNAPKSSVSSNNVTVRKGKRGIWIGTSKETSIKSNIIKGATKSNAIVITSSAQCKTSGNKIVK